MCERDLDYSVLQIHSVLKNVFLVSIGILQMIGCVKSLGLVRGPPYGENQVLKG